MRLPEMKNTLSAMNISLDEVARKLHRSGGKKEKQTGRYCNRNYSPKSSKDQMEKKKKNEPSLWDNFKQSNLCLRYFGWEKNCERKMQKGKNI